MIHELFLVILFLHCCKGLPTYFVDDSKIGADHENKQGSFQTIYLQKYGYLEASDAKVTTTEMADAIRAFQKMAGIPITGVLDETTNATMLLPRCGFKDVDGSIKHTRAKRYSLQGSKWSVKKINYRLINGPTGMKTTHVEETFRKAFNLWSEVSVLNFTKKTEGRTHIDISFVIGNHPKCSLTFDGSGGDIAHAFFPLPEGPNAGDIHFDDSEIWTINSKRGKNLLAVATHEIGHSLGLSHSDNQFAVMAAFYRGHSPNFGLHQDDVEAIQSLYGSDTITQPAIPAYCSYTKIDAICSKRNGDAYVFHDNEYLLLNDTGVEDGFPRPLEDWAGISGPIDAALTLPDGSIFLFKDTRFWEFNDELDLIHGPTNFSNIFNGLPGNLDAAFVWSGNGRMYFIKGAHVWRVNGTHVDPGYPKLLSTWANLPANIDAAFNWTLNDISKTYFFSGNHFYVFNDVDFEVNEASLRFPKAFIKYWFGCPDLDSAERYIAIDDANTGVQEDVDEEEYIVVDGAVLNNDILDNAGLGTARRIAFNIHFMFCLLICVIVFTI